MTLNDIGVMWIQAWRAGKVEHMYSLTDDLVGTIYLDAVEAGNEEMIARVKKLAEGHAGLAQAIRDVHEGLEEEKAAKAGG